LAARYWRTAVVITICSLGAWVLRRRPEIRKAGWRLIVPQIAVFILAMAGENHYIDHLRATRNQKQQVYVVLSFQSEGLEEEDAQLKRISARVRATLNTALDGLGQIQVEPRVQNTDWPELAAASERLKALDLDPDVVLLNTAKIDGDGEHIQIIDLYSEVETLSSDLEKTSCGEDNYSQVISRHRGDLQLSYLTLALTIDLLQKLSASHCIDLSPEQKLKAILNLGKRYKSLAQRDRLEAPTLKRLNDALVSKSLTDKQLQAWVKSHLEPPDPEKAKGVNNALRSATLQKLGR
jgi:hypothetical protein